QPGQGPLRGLRKAEVEGLGDEEVENGVPQVLEALVVGATGAAVRQRPFQEPGVSELVPQSPGYAGSRATLPLHSRAGGTSGRTRAGAAGPRPACCAPRRRNGCSSSARWPTCRAPPCGDP